MTAANTELGFIRAAGDPHAIGLALGRAGRAAVRDLLMRCPLWAQVTDPRHAARVAHMAGVTKARFPAIWAELGGLADGLGLPVSQVMAWNCRGDLLTSVPDGCTTVALPGPTQQIAHNEDGLPFLRGHCFVARIEPAEEPGFSAFCYPGSIPGHTFGWTDAGLVQTVNNLRLTGLQPMVPRMVLGRAVLGCTDLDMTVALLRASPASGGFHFFLGHSRDTRLLSVEFGGGAVSVTGVTCPMAHANHALHLPGAQIITSSSDDRQARAAALLDAGTDALALLADEAGPGLPIRRRAADDPDEENTLASVRFAMSAGHVEVTLLDSRGDRADAA